MDEVGSFTVVPFTVLNQTTPVLWRTEMGNWVALGWAVTELPGVTVPTTTDRPFRFPSRGPAFPNSFPRTLLHPHSDCVENHTAYRHPYLCID